MALTASVFKSFIPFFTWTSSSSFLEGGGKGWGGGGGVDNFQNQPFLKINYQDAH